MVERDEVETIIVKDLSRLGREYLQVGQYTEIYFPEKGVRFIAVNDGVDSLVESSNDFNPIRNWANELHAKDTSKKVRAIKKMQAERGERLGGKPPYGYKKKDKDSKEIIPDEETAPIVRRIFDLCAAGKGPNQIARILTQEQVLNPTNQYYQATIDELTPELLRLFIQRIEVGERSQKYSRSAGQSIRIVYRDIGRVDSPMQEGEHIPHITKQITGIEEIKRLLA